MQKKQVKALFRGHHSWRVTHGVIAPDMTYSSSCGIIGGELPVPDDSESFEGAWCVDAQCIARTNRQAFADAVMMAPLIGEEDEVLPQGAGDFLKGSGFEPYVVAHEEGKLCLDRATPANWAIYWASRGARIGVWTQGRIEWMERPSAPPPTEITKQERLEFEEDVR